MEPSNTESSNANSRRVPPEKRKRTETSCDKCKSRKQKCDRAFGQERVGIPKLQMEDIAATHIPLTCSNPCFVVSLLRSP